MSLDFYLKVVQPCTIYSANITHNLNQMAEAAGIYKALWRPDENGYETAGQIIPILEEGLAKLKANPKKFMKYNASNGWGTYEHFVPFVEEVLGNCREHPDALIEVSR
jgi:hypothetical protein